MVDVVSLDSVTAAVQAYAAGQVAAATSPLQSTINTLQTQLAAVTATEAGDARQLAAAQATIATLQAQLDALLHPERFPGDPGIGKMYYGASVSGGDPSALEVSVGGNLGLFRSYFSPGDSAQTLAARAQRDIAAGRFPVISTHIYGTWRDNANGVYDQWFKDRIIALNTVGKMSFCLDHEPENDEGKGTGADYKAMYLHYKPIVDQLAPNLLLTPIIMGGKYNPTSTPNAAIRLKFSDWLDPAMCHAWGSDGYNHWTPGGSAKWRTPTEVFQPILDGVTALGQKPIIWAEYGVRIDPATPGKAAQWMRDAHDLLLSNGNVIAMSFFSSGQNVNDGGTPWTMTGEVLSAFAALLKGSSHT